MARRAGVQVVAFQRAGSLCLRTLTTIKLEAAEGDAPASSWIQVAMCGSFKKGDHKFAIAPTMLREMVENFSTGQHPVPPTELCIDYEHLSAADTDNPDAGKAAGWIKQLELRNDDAEVWARVEWTPPATAKLQAKEYKFISPEFAFNFTTPTMETIGCTLLAAAITNRPFLQGMEPIALKAGAGDVTLTSDLSYDQQRMLVQRALRVRGQSAGQSDCYYWVAAMNATQVVYEVRDGYLRESYTIDADGTVTFGDDAETVISTFKPPAEAALREDPDMATIKLKSTEGKDVQIDDAVFATAVEASPVVKGLREQLAAKESAQAPLLAKVATLEGDVVAMRRDLTERDADAAVEALVAGGRAVNDQRATLKELYLSDKAMFEKVTTTFAKRVDTTEVGHGQSVPAGGGQGSVVAQVQAKAKELKEKNPQLTDEQATSQALNSDATLYARYVKETEQKVGK